MTEDGRRWRGVTGRWRSPLRLGLGVMTLRRARSEPRFNPRLTERGGCKPARSAASNPPDAGRAQGSRSHSIRCIRSPTTVRPSLRARDFRECSGRWSRRCRAPVRSHGAHGREAAFATLPVRAPMRDACEGTRWPGVDQRRQRFRPTRDACDPASACSRGKLGDSVRRRAAGYFARCCEMRATANQWCGLRASKSNARRRGRGRIQGRGGGGAPWEERVAGAPRYVGDWES